MENRGSIFRYINMITDNRKKKGYFRFPKTTSMNMSTRLLSMDHLARCFSMNGPSSDMECLRSMVTLGTLFIPCSIPNKYLLLKGLKILLNQTSAQILSQLVKLIFVFLTSKELTIFNLKGVWKHHLVGLVGQTVRMECPQMTASLLLMALPL